MNSLKSFILLAFLSISLISSKNLTVKRLLILPFPGGRSHNFILKKLFKYCLSHQDKFIYEFHIIVHNIDIDTWDNEKDKEGYFIYGYGDKIIYKNYFAKSIEMMNNNPNFGFLNFNKGMIKNIEEFMDSGVFNKIKDIKFDICATDVPSFIHSLIVNKLKIKNKLYLSAPILPTILYNLFELNPAYLPTVGSSYTDVMTFSQRFFNQIVQSATELMYTIFMKQQTNFIYKKYGIKLKSSIHFPDAMIMMQYPFGIAFPISTPPNFIMLNAVSPVPAEKIDDTDINDQLNKYKYNIYMSQGTIMNVLNMKEQIKVFDYFKNKNVGFILSVRKGILSEDDIKNIPKNVLIKLWVNQNNLLGDKRINLFITHGGINSVAEAVYHEKPMVVLGIGLDQFNTASYCKKLNFGPVFQNRKDINAKNIIDAINKSLNNQDIINNVKKSSKVLKSLRDAREDFKHWLDFGFENGYESLTIDLIARGKWIAILGIDVFFAYFIILIIFIILFVFMIKKIYSCLCGTCKSKKVRKVKTN